MAARCPAVKKQALAGPLGLHAAPSRSYLYTLPEGAKYVSNTYFEGLKYIHVAYSGQFGSPGLGPKVGIYLHTWNPVVEAQGGPKLQKLLHGPA